MLVPTVERGKIIARFLPTTSVVCPVGDELPRLGNYAPVVASYANFIVLFPVLSISAGLAARLAVPEKCCGLSLFLAFFDRCGNSVLPFSATGSGRPEFPVKADRACRAVCSLNLLNYSTAQSKMQLSTHISIILSSAGGCRPGKRCILGWLLHCSHGEAP